MTIPHQGIGRGRLVPSSNKGSKFRYTIVRQFSRGDERIREDIPIPDSLGKETFQVGIGMGCFGQFLGVGSFDLIFESFRPIMDWLFTPCVVRPINF